MCVCFLSLFFVCFLEKVSRCSSVGMEVGRIREILGKGAKCDVYDFCKKKLYNVLYEKKKGKNALNYDHFWNLTAGTTNRRLLRCGACPSAAAVC